MKETDVKFRLAESDLCVDEIFFSSNDAHT